MRKNSGSLSRARDFYQSLLLSFVCGQTRGLTAVYQAADWSIAGHGALISNEKSPADCINRAAPRITTTTTSSTTTTAATTTPRPSSCLCREKSQDVRRLVQSVLIARSFALLAGQSLALSLSLSYHPFSPPLSLSRDSPSRDAISGSLYEPLSIVDVSRPCCGRSIGSFHSR